MKRLIVFTFSFLFVFSLYGQDNDHQSNKTNKFTDNAKGTSMMPIIGDVISAVQYLEDSLGVEVVRIEYDIIQDKKSSFRTLYKDYNYGIVAVGDYRIKRLKLEAFEQKGKKWKLLNSNDRSSYLALLTLSPEETAEYSFDVTIQEFVKGYTAGHYAIIYYH
jgi:hypothetical protein